MVPFALLQIVNSWVTDRPTWEAGEVIKAVHWRACGTAECLPVQTCGIERSTSEHAKLCPCAYTHAKSAGVRACAFVRNNVH
jgi:hypothetical protein